MDYSLMDMNTDTLVVYVDMAVKFGLLGLIAYLTVEVCRIKARLGNPKTSTHSDEESNPQNNQRRYG